VGLDETGESLIRVGVETEVVSAHIAPVFGTGLVVIGYKIEVGSCLGNYRGTYLYYPRNMWSIALVWNQVQVSRNLLETIPTLYKYES
jgi:hypothetical protein